MLRQIGDKDQKIQNLEALLQKSKENISLLEKEREDLYAKIQAGEGETAVLKQLQEKNHTLQQQVRVQTANVGPSFAQSPVNYIECFIKTVHDPGFSCFKCYFLYHHIWHQGRSLCSEGYYHALTTDVPGDNLLPVWQQGKPLGLWKSGDVTDGTYVSSAFVMFQKEMSNKWIS